MTSLTIEDILSVGCAFRDRSQTLRRAHRQARSAAQGSTLSLPAASLSNPPKVRRMNRAAKRRCRVPYYVYILRCSDGSYTGKSCNLDPRLSDHDEGIGSEYTKLRRPLKCVWSETFPTDEQAFEVERQIKGWTRAKKEALIKGDFNLLHELAKSTEKRRREKGQ
jgi:putative endonuclease